MNTSEKINIAVRILRDAGIMVTFYDVDGFLMGGDENAIELATAQEIAEQYAEYEGIELP